MIEYQCPDGLAGTVKHDDAVNQRFGLIGSGLGRLCKSVTGSFYSPRAREFELLSNGQLVHHRFLRLAMTIV